MRRPLALLVVCAGVIAGAIAAFSASPVNAAQPDRISVSGARGRAAEVLATARTVAGDIGARVTVVRAGTVDLSVVRRPNQRAAVQQARDGWGYPMSIVAMNADASEAVIGPGVAAALRRNQIVMNKVSADLRGAVAGDTVRLRGPSGRDVDVTIGAVTRNESSSERGEILMSLQTADQLGFTREAYAIVYALPGRDSALKALKDAMPRGTTFRVRGSWEWAGADTVLPQGRLKALLGEYQVFRSDPLRPDPGWYERNIVREEVPIIGAITCHKTVMPAIRRALQQVRDAGLAGEIDVADTRRAGGCYNAREVVSTTGRSATLSRHSWGAALDINPSTNAFGATPTMDEDIVEIFRRNGFAWGGTWLVPDGMHFEYVAEPRA
jgi:hypothetical protein